MASLATLSRNPVLKRDDDFRHGWPHLFWLPTHRARLRRVGRLEIMQVFWPSANFPRAQARRQCCLHLLGTCSRYDSHRRARCHGRSGRIQETENFFPQCWNENIEITVHQFDARDGPEPLLGDAPTETGRPCFDHTSRTCRPPHKILYMRIFQTTSENQQRALPQYTTNCLGKCGWQAPR